MKHLKRYFQFLEEEGLLFASPLRDWKAPKLRWGHYPALGQKEVERMLDGIAADTSSSIRARAILEIAYSSALRPRELYHLRIQDIDFRGRNLFIRQSKNRKDRLVPVGKIALRWLRRYIQEVRPQKLHGQVHDHVFISHKSGRSLTLSGMWRAIQEPLRKAGFRALKPYSLRTSAATHLLHEGMGILYISRLLGHRDVRTTMYYLRVNVRDLSRVLSSKHPRARMEQQITKRKETLP